MEPTTSEQLGSFEIYYRPQGLRPIQASVAELPTVAVGWAKEMLEDLDARAANRSDGGFAQVCAHLKKVQAIVDIQFSTWPSDDPGWPMGEVITYETARWIARNAEGLMEDHRGTWWALADTTWWNKVYDGRPSS
jgi:hypothetical protein